MSAIWYLKKKILRPMIWRTLAALPVRLRSRIIRSYFKVPLSLPSELTFKLATTREEREAAFEILYAEFLRSGYMSINQSRLRVLKYHLLPGTTLLIGKWRDEVICTLSVIRDSAWGLPIDTTWDISSLRAPQTRVAEISSLAIKKCWQGAKGQILLPLCKFMYEFTTSRTDIDVLVISTLTSVKDFYRSILLFEYVGDGTPVKYSFVKGVSAVAQYLDLRDAPTRYSQVYGGKAVRENIYDFFTSRQFPNFQLPTGTLGQCLYVQTSAKDFDYFYNKRTDLLASLTTAEKKYLRGLYDREDYLKVIGNAQLMSFRRDCPRFTVSLFVQLESYFGGSLQTARLEQVAVKGLSAKLAGPISLDQPCRIVLKINERKIIKLLAQPVWSDTDFRYGFKIFRKPSLEWISFVKSIESSFYSTDDETPFLRKTG
jgi:hypothetical protein